MHAFTLSRRSQPPHRCTSATFHWRPVYGRLINKSADGSAASSRSPQRARVYMHGKKNRPNVQKSEFRGEEEWIKWRSGVGELVGGLQAFLISPSFAGTLRA